MSRVAVIGVSIDDMLATLRVVSTRLDISVAPTRVPLAPHAVWSLRATKLCDALNRVYGPDTFTVQHDMGDTTT